MSYYIIQSNVYKNYKETDSERLDKSRWNSKIAPNFWSSSWEGEKGRADDACEDTMPENV